MAVLESRSLRLACLAGFVGLAPPAEAAPQIAPVQTWVELPQAFVPNSEDFHNAAPNDTGLVDLLVRKQGRGYVRAFYSADGRFDNLAGVDYHGNLRAVDFLTPIPDLLPWSGGVMPQSAGEAMPAIPNWNDVLTSGWTKMRSLQSVLSVRGTVFVSLTAKRKDGDVENWNGLSVLDGLARPQTAFDPTSGELWSSGSAEGVKATPEGSAYATTDPGETFLFVPNYCGQDAAGLLLVQVISNLSSINNTQRYEVDLYQLLGAHMHQIDGGATPAVQQLGPEVATNFFYRPPNLGGNKIKSVVTVRVAEGVPFNAERLLLFVTMNLDPVDIVTGLPLDGTDSDDGRYDYLAVVDISQMTAAGEPGPGEWRYDVPAEWDARIRFLRLPPDVPPGWTAAQYPSGLSPGDDWSDVQVPPPPSWPSGVPAPPPAPEQIVGSGVLVSMTAHPDDTHLYVVSDDHGAQTLATVIFDGGWHVPHLYTIDLGAADFAIQSSLNAYSHVVKKDRINKLLYHNFGQAGGTGSNHVGWALVGTTIPGWPNGTGEWEPGVQGIDLMEPQNRCRLVAVKNSHFSVDPARLYIGGVGRFQNSDNADGWPEAGGFYVLTLANPLAPAFKGKYALPHVSSSGPPHFYHAGGIAVISGESPWLADVAGSRKRNVYFVTAADSAAPDINTQDLMLIGQDVE
ncbi:MAG: hypothetical protein H0V12_10535 [Chloroflexi bacterium]|nr:hypothetical protein [Chloroflexota bacterium]